MSPLESMKSENAYAAWSMNEKERETSASGGVAAEMYKWAIDKEYKIIGAVQQDDFCVCHDEAQLRHPSLKTKYRKMFEEDIEKYHGDFEKAIKRAQNKYMREEKINRIMALPKRAVKKIIKIIGIK